MVRILTKNTCSQSYVWKVDIYLIEFCWPSVSSSEVKLLHCVVSIEFFRGLKCSWRCLCAYETSFIFFFTCSYRKSEESYFILLEASSLCFAVRLRKCLCFAFRTGFILCPMSKCEERLQQRGRSILLKSAFRASSAFFSLGCELCPVAGVWHPLLCLQLCQSTN